MLATVFLLILGAVAEHDAAELLAPVLAQSPSISRGPGLYLNLYKFIPVVVIYLLWTWTTDWVEHDTKELNNIKFAALEQRGLFLGGARADPDLRDPHLPYNLALLFVTFLVPILVYSCVFRAIKHSQTTRRCSRLITWAR